MKKSVTTRVLLGAALGLAIAGGVSEAQVTPSNAEVVFLVDESGSMGGEHNFLPGFVTDLEAQLAGNGVTSQFGLVGYGNGLGGGANLGRTFPVGTGLLGNATEFGVAAGNLVLSGGFEDGYSAIDFALQNYPAMAGVSRTFVLVTDEDRDNGNNALDFNSLRTALNNQGISLVVIVNGNITTNQGAQALATDGTTAFVQNGAGFVTAPLGSTAGGFGTTDADYIQLALQTPNGCAADLNQLRAGGQTATAFAAVLQQCLAAAAVGAPPPTINNLFLNVYRDSVFAIQLSIDNQISQIVQVDPTSDLIVNALAQATDDTAIIEDILNVEGLRAYIIFDYMSGDFDAFGNNKQFDYDGGGVVVGVDYTQDNLLGLGETTTFGIAGAYHVLNNSVSVPLGSLDTNTFSAQLYAQVKMPEGVYGRANAQFSFTSYDQRRIVGATVFGADPNGFAFSGDIEAGYAFDDLLPAEPEFGLFVTPFASIGIDYRSVDGFQETNGGVLVASFDDTSLMARIGGRLTLTYDADADTTLFFGVEVAGLFDLLDDDQIVLINNGALPSERIEAVDDVTLQLGVNAGARIGDMTSLFVGYDAGISANAFQNTVAGGVVIHF